MTAVDDKTNILFVQRPAGGGSMTCLVDLVRALDRDRFTPHVLLHYANTGFEDVFAEMGAKVHCLNRPRVLKKGGPQSGNLGHERPKRGFAWSQIKRFLRSDMAVAKLIEEVIRREDIALVHHNDNPRGDRGSILGARRAGVPQTCHVRYTPLYYPALDRRITKSVRRFVPMSKAIKEHLTANLGPLQVPADVLYDPFHFNVHDGVLENSPVDRSEFGFKTDDFVLANIGRIMGWKGQDVFLQALRKAVDVVPSVKAVIVGAPTEKEASKNFWTKLQQMTKDLGLEEVVTFAGFRKDVPSIMAASDCVVHTATMAEPFGKVLVEAMASRRPVIATAFGGPLEIVEEGKTGLLVPASDPDSLASAIIQLASDPERARTMGAEGRSVAQSRYGVDTFRDTLSAVFTDVLKTA